MQKTITPIDNTVYIEREYQSSVNSIFKLTGEVVLLKPGTLPKDGLVIEDKRTYDP